MYSSINSFQSILMKYNAAIVVSAPSTTSDWNLTTVASVNGIIYASAYDSVNNLIYIGGNFTTVTDYITVNQSAKYIAVWNVATSRFSCLGNTSGAAINGLSGLVNCMILDNINRRLYIGGTFSLAYDNSLNGQSARNLVIYNLNNSKFYSFGVYNTATNGVNNTVLCLALNTSNNIIYAGGSFTTYTDPSYASGSAKCVVGWSVSTSRFVPLGVIGTTNNGVGDWINTTNKVNALAIDIPNQVLYLGGLFVAGYDGSFNGSGGPFAPFLIKYYIPARRFAPVRYGVNNEVNALALDSSNGILYIGGVFYQSNLCHYMAGNRPTGGSTGSQIMAKYDVSNNIIKPIDQSYNIGHTNSWFGSCSCYDTSNNMVYFGGAANYSGELTDRHGPISARCIVAWSIKDTRYYLLGNTGRSGSNNGVNNTVYAMAIDISNQLIYLGGSFTTTQDTVNNGTVVTNRVAVYNIITQRFSPLGGVSTNNGVNNMVLGMVLDKSTNRLYLTGSFTIATNPNATTVTVNRFAAWNLTTNTFINLGITLGGQGQCMDIDRTNNLLYIGGNFTSSSDASGGKTMRNITKYDISMNRFIPLGTSTQNGTSAYVTSVCVDSSNNKVYIGGNFTTTYDAFNNGRVNYANYMCIWDNINNRFLQFSNPNYPGANGTNGMVVNIKLDPLTQRIYYGGNFKFSNVVDASAQLIYYDLSLNKLFNYGQGIGATFSAAIGKNSWMCLDSSNDILYLRACDMTTVFDGSNSSGFSVRTSVALDLKTHRFSCLGGNANGSTINGTDTTYSDGGDQIIDISRGIIYMSGGFTTVSDASTTNLSARYVVSYDIKLKRFIPLGTYNSANNGTNNQVFKMDLDVSRNILYLCGTFTSCADATGTRNTFGVVSWNGNTKQFVPMGTAAKSGLGFFNLTTAPSVNGIFYYSPLNRVYIFGGSINIVYDDSLNTTTGARINGACYWDVSSQRYYSFGGTTAAGAGASRFGKVTMDVSNGVLYGILGGTDLSGSTKAVHNGGYDFKMDRFIVSGGPDLTKMAYVATNCPNGINSGFFGSVFDNVNGLLYVGHGGTTAYDSNNFWNFTNNAVGGGIYNPRTRTWSGFGTPAVNGCSEGWLFTHAPSIDYKRNRMYMFTNNRTINVPDITVSTMGIGYFDLNTKTFNPLGLNELNKNGITPAPSNSMIEITPDGVFISNAQLNHIYAPDWCQTANGLIGYNIKNDRFFQLGGPSTYNNYNNGIDNNISKDMATRYTHNYFNTDGLYYLPDIFTRCKYASVIALTFEPATNNLYIGGSFNYSLDSSNGSIPTKNITCYNATTNTFSNLGRGTDLSVNTITLGNSGIYNNKLKYVGGSFNNIYNLNNTGYSANKFGIMN